MCGIAGIVNRDGSPVDPAVPEAMNQAQFHRGPDSGDIWLGDGVGLAHRRLAIIDIAAGFQPLVTADGRRVIVFNGEIYNFRTLRKELEQLGHEFRTHSDTEVILQAWHQWGTGCVHRLRGMFAFAIWDRDKQTLFLARDRIGIKPLYVLEAGNTLAFASELKALELVPGLSRELDDCAIADFFTYGYIPDPRSIYRQVRKLPPGHWLLWQKGNNTTEQRCYWKPSFTRRRTGEESTLAEELVDTLKSSVESHLVSEVPVGAFLSGGVDSSAVVALMAGALSEPVNTCSIGFDVPDYNETDFARMVAERYHTRHRERTVAVDDFELIDDLAGLYDEPFADSSAIPTYRVCQLAKEEVTVCLSGDGGDELFAGYRRHRWHMLEERIRSRVPERLRAPLFRFLGDYYPKLDWAPRWLRAKSTFQALQRDALAAYLHTVSIIPEQVLSKLFTPQFHRRLSGYRPIEHFEYHRERYDGDDPLGLIQYLDMQTYLPGDILTKVDRASMAHSLEVRVPLLDHEVIEWANNLPADLKLRGREGKYLLKKGMEPHLPGDVLYRDKMGFAVPISRWFRGPLADRLRQRVLHGQLQEAGIFQQATLERLVDEHLRGVGEHSAALWALLMFESVLARVHGAERRNAA